MKIAVLDDYQGVARTLPSFAKLAGCDVTVWTDHVEDDVLAQRLADTDALILIRERTPITAGLLARLPRLRLISQFGTVPHIDLQACARHGVTVCSRIVPGGPSYATAELTWGLILAATRRIPQEAQSLKDGHWQSPLAVGRKLRGLTLGVFGFGRIGGVVAEYGRAFGMDVLVWGREATLQQAREKGWAAAPDQRELFRRADVLTVHVGLTAANRGIIKQDDLLAMKPDALFVNTSRAQLVESGALVSALQAGRPGFAAVDVFEHEPMLEREHPLLNMTNVIATPHIGYAEREGLAVMFDTMVDQVLAFARGEPINVLAPAGA
jgi:D-3-phosphoglycerate dehydrogenase